MASLQVNWHHPPWLADLPVMLAESERARSGPLEIKLASLYQGDYIRSGFTK